MVRHRVTGVLPRSCLALLFILLPALSLVAPAAYFQQSPPPASPAGDLSAQELDKLLAIAQTRLEIIKVLIAQAKFDRVLPEMKAILQSNLPDKCDGQITDAALIVAKLLVDQSQYGVAQKVLDETLLRVKGNPDKARLLQMKAGIFKLEGRLKEALATWEQALSLIRQQNQ